MKKSRFTFLAIMAFVMMAVGCNSNRGIIERPFIGAANTRNLSFEQVEVTDSATILHGVVHYYPGYWVRLSPDSEIRVDGTGYPVSAVDGITLGEQIVMPDSGVVRFTMTFPAIPKNAKSIDFWESPDDGWKVWGIDLTGKANHNINEKSVPAAAKRQREMPVPDFAYGDSTVVNVHLLGYKPEMGNKLTWCVNTLHGQIGADTPVEVDKDGNAVVKLDLSAPAYFMPIEVGKGVSVGNGTYVAPGENLNVYVDTHSSGIWNMEVRDNVENGWPEGYYSTYTDGVYPFVKNRIPLMELYSGEFGDYHMNGDEYTAYVINTYKSLNDTIDANKSLSDDERRYNKVQLMGELITVASMDPKSVLARNYYMKSGAMWGTPIPEDSITCVLSRENLQEIASYIDFQNKGLLLSDAISNKIATSAWDYAGIDAGVLKTVENYCSAYAKADNGTLKTPVDASLNLNEALTAELEAHSAAVIARIEALGTERVSQTPDVAADEVFDAIIAPHKGKVVMVDLWNTWCGPCRAAIAENEPEKSGDLSSDDIVWIYIANQTSPRLKYLQMIQDIKGIHYQLEPDAWRAICDRFGVDGIPFYILVDRNGKAEGRPDLRDHRLYKKTLLESLSR